MITLEVQGGEFTLFGSATATTITVSGGKCYYASSGTLTTANVSNGGVLDFQRDNSSRGRKGKKSCHVGIELL